jgi:hypothetical protein
MIKIMLSIKASRLLVFNQKRKINRVLKFKQNRVPPKSQTQTGGTFNLTSVFTLPPSATQRFVQLNRSEQLLLSCFY